MPIFDFKCKGCGKVMKDVYFQRWAVDGEVDDLKCTKCKGTEFEKLPSFGSVRIK